MQVKLIPNFAELLHEVKLPSAEKCFFIEDGDEKFIGKWIKNGEKIPGRVNTKMKVEFKTGEHSICVKPSLTGVMYGFKNDEEYGPFSIGIYITTNSVLEFIGTNETVYSVLIRKNKRSSETVDKSIKVLGNLASINMQLKNFVE